jgi:hypothetical protein
MATPRLRLGQLLVDARMLSEQALDEVLAAQRSDGRRLGTLLVEQGYINETQLTQILSHQLAVPWVSLLHIEFSRQLLNLVPREVAERYCLVPIYVRHVRNQGETLYVAMDDPTNDDGLKQCNLYSGLPVRAMIAPPSDIRSAIRVYYGASMRPDAAITEPPMTEADPNAQAQELEPSLEALVQQVSDSASRITQPELPEISVVEEELDMNSRPTLVADEPEDEGMRPTLESIPTDELLDAAGQELRATRQAALLGAVLGPEPEPPALFNAGRDSAFAGPSNAGRDSAFAGPSDAGPSEAPPEEVPSEPEPEVKEIAQPRGRGRRMVSLTFLDGTTIALPARAQRSKPAPEPEPEAAPPGSQAGESALTARDLVEALRAVSHGADANEVLGGNVRWEAMFAALLSLLLKKHLIADWEFVDELKEM